MKNIAIIGATGSTGKELVRLALEANYQVTVVVRNPDAVQPEKKVTLMQGDVTNLGSLELALKNIDFVVSCFGPSDNREIGTFMSVGVSNIVQACEKNKVQRFVFMSGFVQANYNDFSVLNQLSVWLLRQYYHQSYHDKIIAERHIQHSVLDWTIVRATSLKNSAPSGQYKAGIKTKIHPFTMLSYADCAQCLLDAVEEKNWSRQVINVGKK